MDFVLLQGIPMPPSANNAFINRRDGLGRAKGEKYRAFERDVAYWSATNSARVDAAARLIADRDQHDWLIVDAYFTFPRSKLVTMKGGPKRLDVDNRLKILNDALTKVLAFDDALIASQRIEKIGSPTATESHVDVLITRRATLSDRCPWGYPTGLAKPERTVGSSES